MRRAHAMPFGAQVTGSGVRFSLWAPSAKTVSLVLNGRDMPMPKDEAGWCNLVVPEAGPGDRYRFRIDQSLEVPDPASRFQPDDVHRESMVVDPGAFVWTDDAWTGRPWEDTVLSEVHVGTATPEGTYAGLAARLEQFRDWGITAIELLPLAEFPGRRNWGYDGVLPFAPDSAYGSPDDLKRLIDRAHSLGLMIFVDAVYNHFGPSGNYLHAYAGSFFTERHQTPWGAGINFDGPGGETVRDFFVHNAIYWLEEYHVDGLRLDAVHAILDDSERHIIAEIAERVRSALPGRFVHLVLENDANEARWLPRGASGVPNLHTAQWNDDLHHCWHTLLTGESDGYYADYADHPVARLARCLAEGFAYQGEPSPHRDGKARGEPSAFLPPSAFVAFLQNHDQIGNRAFGERLTTLAPQDWIALARAALLLGPQIPMLYMGEEWGSTTPFLYFVDFEDDENLANAVREGRRREFARFKSFSEQHDAMEIPDPTVEETFARSRLDWGDLAKAPYSDILSETRRLLRIRTEAIVPMTGSKFLGSKFSQPDPSSLDVSWHFERGRLRFMANFGDADLRIPLDRPGREIWKSEAASQDGADALLPPWTGIFFMDGAA